MNEAVPMNESNRIIEEWGYASLKFDDILKCTVPVELHPPSATPMHCAVIILPGDAEADGALRFRHGNERSLVKLAVGGIGKQRLEVDRHLLNGLKKDRLMLVILCQH